MIRKIFRALIGLGPTRVQVDDVHLGGSLILRSNGLSEAGLPEIEISDCPPHLKEVAINLIQNIALNRTNTPESFTNGKTIRARFAGKDQILIESFKLAQTGADHPILRIVDLDQPDGGFPYRLVATHLCAVAESSRSDALRLLLVASEVWPKERAASNAMLGDFEFNPNNFWTWINLGTNLSESGQIDEAILRWKIGVCMWPRGGKLFALRMVGRGAPNSSNSDAKKTAHDFWLSVTNEIIIRWCAELSVELPAAALADSEDAS